MDAFTKIMPPGVIKGGKECTILESEPECLECKWKLANNEFPSSEVACCTRICRRSMTVQTKFFCYGKNFRHVYTNTDDLKNCEVKQEKHPAPLAFPAAETSTCYNNVPIQIDINFQEPNGLGNDTATDVTKDRTQNAKLCPQNSHKCVAVEQCDRRMPGYRAADKRTPVTVMYNKSVCTDNKLFGKYEKNDSSQCWQGHVAIRPFTLGTTEYRRFRKDSCRTKLIGGYRVPVCTNKARF